MIIRRKRTKNFTVINNAIFDDDQLSLESLGVLTYLLSKPADWSVSLAQLRCRFNIGREKIQKIIRKLIATGYIENYRTRNPETNEYNGIEYIVYDQPQKPQPENSIVDGPQPEKPRAENPADLTRTDSNKISPQKSPQGDGCGISENDRSEDIEPTGFEAFEPAWPWGTIERRDAARRIFEILDDQDRGAAIAGIALYHAEAKRIGRKTVHASTYLRSKLWENFGDEPSPPKECDQVFVPVVSPLWKGCSARWRKESQMSVEALKFEGEGGTLGWWFPAHWPETSSTPPHIHIGGGQMTAPPFAASLTPPNHYGQSAARKRLEASDGQDGDARARERNVRWT